VRTPRSLLISLLFCSSVLAQTTVEISEPATVPLANLFAQADVVAVVQVVSGDSESYDAAVYKSKVLTVFKGAQQGQHLFFGPYVGYEVGSQYVVFLRRANAGPKMNLADARTVSYGTIDTFHLIMFQGYSIMPIRYECAFDGKVPSESCDYGVRLNTDQVKLPSGIKTFPRTSKDDFVDANRWVRKDAFLHLLKTLQK
jgi:hypothetical protein